MSTTTTGRAVVRPVRYGAAHPRSTCVNGVRTDVDGNISCSCLSVDCVACDADAGYPCLACRYPVALDVTLADCIRASSCTPSNQLLIMPPSSDAQCRRWPTDSNTISCDERAAALPTDPGCQCTQRPCLACTFSRQISPTAPGGWAVTEMCSVCDSRRIVLHGKCVVRYRCDARRITSFTNLRSPYHNLSGMPCRCADPHCHRCTRESAGETCRGCRDGFYLLDGRCVASCPPHLASSGINLFGRRCLEPFGCQVWSTGRGRIFGLDVPWGCKCPDRDCGVCVFNAGGSGEICRSCLRGKFRVGERCVAACPPELPVEYWPARSGRECVEAPLNCTLGLLPDGRPCRCPNPIGVGRSCLSCEFNAGLRARCLRCGNHMYLNTRTGRCQVGCPDRPNVRPIDPSRGLSSEGRVCDYLDCAAVGRLLHDRSCVQFCPPGYVGTAGACHRVP